MTAIVGGSSLNMQERGSLIIWAFMCDDSEIDRSTSSLPQFHLSSSAAIRFL